MTTQKPKPEQALSGVIDNLVGISKITHITTKQVSCMPITLITFKEVNDLNRVWVNGNTYQLRAICTECKRLRTVKLTGKSNKKKLCSKCYFYDKLKN